LYNPKLGFQKEVDQQLNDEMKIEELADWQKHVGLVVDEVTIKNGSCMTSIAVRFWDT
jgi:hypothetical protein